MKCINCDQEIGQNQVVAFMFGDNLETYPVCKMCMDRLAQTAQVAQIEIENSLENYTPGIIEEEL